VLSCEACAQDRLSHMNCSRMVGSGIGRSFTSRPQVEFFATVGLTWTFDAPWKRRNH
jgi:hypothetical protein